jgi:acyl-CoA dehydrogenase
MLAPLSSAAIEAGENLADEERDDVMLGEPGTEISLAPDVLLLRGALVRAALMAAALERICELSLSHARQRQQFGRAIGSFQAVQAHLVTIAQQTALVAVAVDAAVARESPFEIAVAKVLAGRAAVTASRAAHQVHGAVGVTRAHPLGVETRRLWAWRCEYGDERAWANRLGDAVLQAGANRLYPAITAGSQELEV